MTVFERVLQLFIPSYRSDRSPTVRYAFPVVFGAALFLGAQAIVSQSSSEIIVVPSSNSVRAGETFSIDVFVSAQTEVNAVDLELEFPIGQMEITGIDTGSSVITLWTQEPYVEENTVYLRGGTFRRGFIGEHKIATINATAKASGIAEISVAEHLLLAGDGSGNEVSVADEAIDTAKVYIANEDGSYNAGADPNVISGTVSIQVTTDIDGNGEVDLADVSRFMSAWFSRDMIFDFDNDGSMTFTDFGIVLADSFFR